MDEFSIAYCSWPVECVVSAVRELPILRTKKCVFQEDKFGYFAKQKARESQIIFAATESSIEVTIFQTSRNWPKSSIRVWVGQPKRGEVVDLGDELWFRCALLQGELPWKKRRCHPCGKGWTFLSTRKREISLCAIQMFCPCALWTPLSGIWMHMTIWLPSFGDRGKWETTSVDQTRLHVICVLRYSNIEMKDPPSVVVGIFRIGTGCFPILVY